MMSEKRFVAVYVRGHRVYDRKTKTHVLGPFDSAAVAEVRAEALNKQWCRDNERKSA
jgi:hypothetical protein